MYYYRPCSTKISFSPWCCFFLSSEIMSCSSWTSSYSYPVFYFLSDFSDACYFSSNYYMQTYFKLVLGQICCSFLHLINDFVSLKIFQAISRVLVGTAATVSRRWTRAWQDLLPSSHSCWVNLVPCHCRTEISTFLLTVIQGPLSLYS